MLNYLSNTARFFMLLAGSLFINIAIVAQVSPSCAKTGEPTTFTIDGFAAGNTYTVSVDGGTAFMVDAQTFEYTFDAAGDHSLSVSLMQSPHPLNVFDGTVSAYDFDLGNDVVLYANRSMSDFEFTVQDFGQTATDLYKDGIYLTSGVFDPIGIYKVPFTEIGNYEVRLAFENGCTLSDNIQISRSELSTFDNGPFSGCYLSGDLTGITVKILQGNKVYIKKDGTLIESIHNISTESEYYELILEDDATEIIIMYVLPFDTHVGAYTFNVLKFNELPSLSMRDDFVRCGADAVLQVQSDFVYDHSLEKISVYSEGSSVTPEFAASNPGTYTYNYETNTSNDGTVSCPSISKTITVHDATDISLSIENSVFDAADKDILFEALIDPEITADSYLWEFSDGQTFTTQEVTRSFSSLAPQSVTLTAIIDGCEFTATKQLTPKIFSIDDLCALKDLNHAMRVSGDVYATHCVVDFGDGSQQETFPFDFLEANGYYYSDVMHVYAQEGSYDLDVAVFDGETLLENLTEQIRVKEFNLPTHIDIYTDVPLCIDESSLGDFESIEWYFHGGENGIDDRISNVDGLITFDDFSGYQTFDVYATEGSCTFVRTTTLDKQSDASYGGYDAKCYIGGGNIYRCKLESGYSSRTTFSNASYSKMYTEEAGLFEPMINKSEILDIPDGVYTVRNEVKSNACADEYVLTSEYRVRFGNDPEVVLNDAIYIGDVVEEYDANYGYDILKPVQSVTLRPQGSWPVNLTVDAWDYLHVEWTSYKIDGGVLTGHTLPIVEDVEELTVDHFNFYQYDMCYSDIGSCYPGQVESRFVKANVAIAPSVCAQNVAADFSLSAFSVEDLRLPTSGAPYNRSVDDITGFTDDYSFVIDFGDGSSGTYQTLDFRHAYSAAGEYEMKIEAFQNGLSRGVHTHLVTVWGIELRHTLCANAGDMVTFEAIIGVDVPEHQNPKWTIKDGETVVAQYGGETCSHVFYENKAYPVEFVLQIDGADYVLHDEVVIGRLPILELEIDKRWCREMSELPVITATAGYDSYSWKRLPDGTAVETSLNQYQAQVMGVYEVTAKSGSCQITNRIKVEEFSADFNINPGQCLFVDKAFGVASNAWDAHTWQWQFGQDRGPDGQETEYEEEGREIQYVYYSPEYYLICHYAENSECQDTKCKRVNVGMYPKVDFMEPRLCQGEKTDLVSAAVGEDNTQWKWEIVPENGAPETIYGHSPEFFSGKPGNVSISLEVTNACGRKGSKVKELTISEKPDVKVTAVNGNTACPSAELEFRAIDQNASDGLSYTWYRDNNSDDIAEGESYLASFASEGNHVVNLKASNLGCDQEVKVPLYITTPPQGSLLVNGKLATGTFTACPSNLPELSAWISNYDSELEYSFRWVYEGLDVVFGGEAPTKMTAEQSGTYELYARNGQCDYQLLGSIVVDVQEFSQPQLTVSPETCPGNADGSVSLSFPDGLFDVFGGVDYEWNTPNNGKTGLAGGTYSVKVVANASGCFKEYFFEVPTHELAIGGIFASPAACNGTSMGEVRVEADPSYTYSWAHDPVLSGPQAQGLNTGAYTVTVSDGQCQETLSAVVSKPQLYVRVKTSASCGGGITGRIIGRVHSSSDLPDPQADYTLNWYYDNYFTNSIALGNSSEFTYQKPFGTYSVQVEDAHTGCVSEKEEFVIEPGSKMTATLHLEQPSCEDFSGKAKVTVTGGTLPLTYDWGSDMPDVNKAELSGLSAGFINVLVYDARGCSASGQGNLYPGTRPLIIDVTDDASACGIAVEFSGDPSKLYELKWYRYDYDPEGVINTPGGAINNEWQRGGNIVAVSDPVAPGIYSDTELTPGKYIVAVFDPEHPECYDYRQHTVQPARPPLPLNIAMRFVEHGDLELEENIVSEEDLNLISERDIVIKKMLADIDECLVNRMNDVEKSFRDAWMNVIDASELGIDQNEDVLSARVIDERYHYTLYYYDRAGNLVRTVPPKGVEVKDETERISDRNHRFETEYEYNSLNQLVWQQTPDGGISEFAYNEIGQLRFSQNAQQKIDRSYSYSKYDYLGRVIEAGESTEQTSQVEAYISAHFVEESSSIALKDFPADASLKSYVTRTVYTDPADVDYYGLPQENLLNRVSYSYVDKNTQLEGDETYTYYSYDPHGNVKWIVQDVAGFMRSYVAYDYDLVSGNVLMVKYNENRPDRFFHRYSYDADNRLVKVETSRNGKLWDEDANYDYYAHGPLKRTEIGSDKVQGVDYVYNLQGWLKAVNSPSLATGASGDGSQASPFPADVFGMSLYYHKDDYVNDADPFAATDGTSSADLFNGNIASWAYSYNPDGLGDNTPATIGQMVRKDFSYDQLNRLVKSETQLHSGTDFAPPVAADKLFANTSYVYDPNGNIENLKRYDAAGTLDDLNYTYLSDNNQLLSVNDVSLSPDDGRFGDILNHTGDDSDLADIEYQYDQIGNLIGETGWEAYVDEVDGTKTMLFTERKINWTPYGKVADVSVDRQKDENRFDSKKLIFNYGPAGNRVSKEVKHFDASGEENYAENEKTFYLRDASGNTLSVYKRKLEVQPDGLLTVRFIIAETPIYGSDRLGMALSDDELYSIKNVPVEDIDHISFETNEIEIDNNLYHWITPRNKSVQLSASNTACSCVLEQMLFNNETNEYSSSLAMQFMGKAGNNVTLAEDEQQLKFVALTAENYLGSKDVCLVLDRNGKLMKGSQGILSEHQAKAVAMPSISDKNRWNLFTLKEKVLYCSQIDMAASGYAASGDDPAGEVIIDTKNQRISPQGESFGRHMAGVVDHKGSRSLLYALRYNEPEGFGASGLVNIVVFELKGGNPEYASMHVLANVEGLDEYGDGELQLSPDGRYLMVFNRGKQIGGFEHREVDLVVMRLRADMLAVEAGSIQHVSTFKGGAYGKASCAFTQDPATKEVYQMLQQQSTAMQGVSQQTDMPFWRRLFSKKVPEMFTQNEAVTQKGDIRQGNDLRVYVPGAGNGANIATTYPDGTNLDGAQNASQPYALLSSDGQGGSFSEYLLAGSLPGQLLKIGNSYDGQAQYVRKIDLKRYELKDHLGNVRAVVSDRKSFDGIKLVAKTISLSDYYPFGMQMPNRTLSADSYRYGFQGQEKDDEIKGSGNSLNYKFRMYDSRVCRFFAVDPLTWKFPFYSPYHFSSNSPVVAIELEGLESSFRLNYTEGSVEVVDGHVKYTGGLENIPPSNWGHGSAGGTSTPKEGEIINVICTDCVNSKTGLKGTRIWIRVGVTKVIKAETVEDEVPREIKGTHGTNDRIDTDYVTESKGVQYVNGSGEPTKIKDSEVPFTTERQKSRNDAFTDFINQKLEAKSPNEVRSLVSVILVAQENTLYNSSVKRRIEALYGVIVDVNVDGDAMKSYTDKFGFCTQVIYPKIQIQTTTKGSPGTPARTEMVKVSKTVYEEVSPIEIIE